MVQESLGLEMIYKFTLSNSEFVKGKSRDCHARNFARTSLSVMSFI